MKVDGEHERSGKWGGASGKWGEWEQWRMD